MPSEGELREGLCTRRWHGDGMYLNLPRTFFRNHVIDLGSASLECMIANGMEDARCADVLDGNGSRIRR